MPLIPVVLLLSALAWPEDLRDIQLGDISKEGAVTEIGEGVPAVAPPQAGKPAPQSKTKDLKAQFSDPAGRNQCDIGSCHAFGTVAVLEAAYFRKHREYKRLSEADIFIRRTVLSKDLYQDFCAESKCSLTEGNDVLGDVRFAINEGVAMDIDYAGFVERYRKYRAAEEKTLENLLESHKKEPWYVRLLYDPRKHWAELQSRPTAKRVTEMFLAGRDPKIDADRAAVKEKLNGFRPVPKTFEYLGTKAGKLSKENCRKKGLLQKAAIKGELDDDRPVTISMSLSGLPAWGQTDTTMHANHAFAVTGYTEPAGKPLTFQTRNSWGGSNPDVLEDQLCRVYSVVTVLIPGEPKASWE